MPADGPRLTVASTREIEDGAMTNQERAAAAFQVNTGPLLAGAVLVGIGTMLALAGLAISGATLGSAARRYVNSMEVPPSQLAKQQLAKARAATAAGASAWRDGAAERSARSR
jgi:hypothetical protein